MVMGNHEKSLLLEIPEESFHDPPVFLIQQDQRGLPHQDHAQGKLSGLDPVQCHGTLIIPLQARKNPQKSGFSAPLFSRDPDIPLKIPAGAFHRKTRCAGVVKVFQIPEQDPLRKLSENRPAFPCVVLAYNGQNSLNPRKPFPPFLTCCRYIPSTPFRISFSAAQTGKNAGIHGWHTLASPHPSRDSRPPGSPAVCVRTPGLRSSCTGSSPGQAPTGRSLSSIRMKR